MDDGTDVGSRPLAPEIAREAPGTFLYGVGWGFSSCSCRS